MKTTRLLQLFMQTTMGLLVLALAGVGTASAQECTLATDADFFVSSTSGSDVYDGLQPTVNAPQGPFQTINKFLSLGLTNKTVCVEAGIYGPDEPSTPQSESGDPAALAFNRSRTTFKFYPSFANTVVTMNVTPTWSVDQTWTSVGGTTVVFTPTIVAATLTGSDGSDLNSDATLTMSSAFVTLPNGVTVTLTNQGDVGSNPFLFGPNVSFVISRADSFNEDFEFPTNNNFGTGTFTTNGTSATTYGLPGVTTSSATFNGPANVAMSGKLTITVGGGLTVNGGTSHSVADVGADWVTIAGGGGSFGNVNVSQAAGNFTHSSANAVNVGNVSLGANTLVHSGTGTFSATGTVDRNTAADGPIVINSAGTGNFNDLFAHSGAAKAGFVAAWTHGINNSAIMNINGAIREDFNGVSGSTVEVSILNSGTLNLNGTNAPPGSITGDLNNTGTINLGSGVTWTLNHNPLTEVGTIGGAATGTLRFAGPFGGSLFAANSDGFSAIGNVIFAGGGGVVDNGGGATAIVVGNSFTCSAAWAFTNGWNVGGNMTNSSNCDFAAPVIVGGNFMSTATATDSDFASSLTVTGDAQFHGNGQDVTGAFSAGTATIDGTSGGDGSTDFLGPFSVTGDASHTGTAGGPFPIIMGPVIVGGNFEMGGTVRVTGPGPHNVSGEFKVSGTNAFAGGAGPGFFMTFTAGSMRILEDGSNFTLGTFDNLKVQGDFVGGIFDGTAMGSQLLMQPPAFGVAIFSPGPNTRIRTFQAFTNQGIVNVKQSFEVIDLLWVNDDTNLDIEDNQIRVTGATGATVLVAVDAKIISGGAAPGTNTGAIVFETPTGGMTQVLSGLGQVSNMLVNADLPTTTFPALNVSTNMTITGTLTLNNGQVGVKTGATLAFSGNDAGIRRNVTTPLATKILNSGAFTGALGGGWDLTYVGSPGGGFPPVTGREYFTGSGIDDLTTDFAPGTQTATLNSTSNLNISGGFFVSDQDQIRLMGHNLTVSENSSIGSNAWVDDSGTPATEFVVYTNVNPPPAKVGGAWTHDVTGQYLLQVTMTGNGTVNGLCNSNSTACAAFNQGWVVGDGTTPTMVTANNIHDVANGALGAPSPGGTDLAVLGNAALTINTTGNTFWEWDQVFIDENASTTLGGPSTWYVDNVTVGNDGSAGGVAVFDFNDNIVSVDVAFTADRDATFGSGTAGLLTARSAAVGTNATQTSAFIPNMNNSGGSSLSSNVGVAGIWTVNGGGWNFGGNTGYVASRMEMFANITGGTVMTLGTTIDTNGGSRTMNNLTVNSSSSTVLAGGGNLWSTGQFTQLQGSFDISNTHMHYANFQYIGGATTFAQSSGVHMFEGGTLDFNANELSMADVRINGSSSFSENEHNTLYITSASTLTLFAGVFDLLDQTPVPTIHSDVRLVDGARVHVWTGSMNRNPMLDGSVNYTYHAATGTSAELVSQVDDFQYVGGPGVLNVNSPVNFNTFTCQGPVSLNNPTFVVKDGGKIAISGTCDLVGANTYSSAGDFELEVNSPFNPITGGVWPPAQIPALFDMNANSTLPGNRTAQEIRIANLTTLNVTNWTMSVLGDLWIEGQGSGNIVSTPGGGLAFIGAVDQNYFTNHSVTIHNLNIAQTVPGKTVTIQNHSGGTNATTLTTLTNTMFTQGILVTGPNSLTLTHTNTVVQGFTRPAGNPGHVEGNVRKQILGGAVGGPANRYEFPTGNGISVGSFYRPVAITFNNPSAIAAGAGMPSGIFLTASHVEDAAWDRVNPANNNNLPLTAVDDQGNSYKIARMPEFSHHKILTTAALSPSVGFDVEIDIDGFAEFPGENIELGRVLRQKAGAITNFWSMVNPAAANNDNFAVTPTHPVGVVRSAVDGLTPPGIILALGLESNLVVDPANFASQPIPIVVNKNQAIPFNLANAAGQVFKGGTGVLRYGADFGTDNPAKGPTSSLASVGFAGDVMTVTGLAPGTVQMTVTAKDELNDSVTATFDITVNDPLALSTTQPANLFINVGDVITPVDVSGAVTGGTPPYTFAAVSNNGNATVAPAAGSSLLTVTGVTPGTSVITITMGDATAAPPVVTTFTVTVKSALAMTTAPITENLTEGTSKTRTFAITGGEPNPTISAATTPANTTVVSVANEDSANLQVTMNANEPYVGDPVTADTAPILTTVTVTDDSPNGGMHSVATTWTINVMPVLGNVDGFGPNPGSASNALDAFLGLGSPLTAKQAFAADFNAAGGITPFDAALIFDAFLNPAKSGIQANVAANLEFGEANREGDLITIPIQVTGDVNGIVSASLATLIDPAIAKVQSLKSDLGEGWLVRHVVDEEGNLRFAIAGMGEMTPTGVIGTLTLQMTNRSAGLSLSAEGAVNDNPVAKIDAVEVVELPETFALQGNYPNPFNPSTTIQFDLPETADVEIQIFDMLGRRAMVIPAQTIEAGASRSLQLDASALASGSYFYRVIAKMESKTAIESGRMMLVK